MSECAHKWKWVKDWYGDENVVNGICDCSGWVCQECGSTDCEDDPPDNEPDADYLRDQQQDRELMK